MSDPKKLSQEYKSRINKAFDYIEANLNHTFTLEEIAEQAHFSKYHFHRIFSAMVGETPFQFIQRIRLEKAASMLVNRKQYSVSDIAFKLGFTDLSVFSRNFKQYFNVSPSDYRNSNLSQTDSKEKQEDLKSQMYFCFDSQTIKWKTKMELNKSVEVKNLPKMTVAYVRHTGPYAGDVNLFERLWNQLFSWAGPKGLIGPGVQNLIVYHDDPKVTEEDKLRISVCISVNPDQKVDGEVGKMEIEEGDYVVARFVLNDKQFPEAWGWVYGEWLPNSGYQPDDRPCFEMYPEEPKDGKITVDICVPVKPL